ncbi:hypothetical protein SELMODRAFT_431497 [Selaginella moellendorffii]|uniref:Pentatricopeptide repeat-containing protein n=1 Tax=Selaginella moellendorffii TaxID=88036 RepID=D8TCV0_SELML|nr:hypothetical protein SELMODRAFT_431497 [Selaginella moellendorffii]
MDMYSKCRSWGSALELFFERMTMRCYEPDSFTCIAAPKACGGLARMGSEGSEKLVLLNKGIVIHKQAVEHGFASSLKVASTLVYMYSKCGDMRRVGEIGSLDLRFRNHLVNPQPIGALFIQCEIVRGRKVAGVYGMVVLVASRRLPLIDASLRPVHCGGRLLIVSDASRDGELGIRHRPERVLESGCETLHSDCLLESEFKSEM